MIWTAIHFPTPGNLASARVLGNLRAPHLGAAQRRAAQKWPDIPGPNISLRTKMHGAALAAASAERKPAE